MGLFWPNTTKIVQKSITIPVGHSQTMKTSVAILVSEILDLDRQRILVSDLVSDIVQYLT